MPLIATNRAIPTADTSATEGRILWDAPKSLWWFGNMAGAITAITVFPQRDAVLVMLILIVITVCAGHSAGMHRLLIHRTFEAPLWLERLLVWLGTLVGMAAPISVFDIHDSRDWHKHQTVCPAHPAHSAGFWQDGWWQLHCKFVLNHPPATGWSRVRPTPASGSSGRWKSSASPAPYGCPTARRPATG